MKGALGRLDDRWKVLHDVPLARRGGFDHVVVGPGGVFTLSEKGHPGGRILVQGELVLVNRRSARYVAVTRSEAHHAARLLTDAVGFNVLVTGVVVLGAGAVDIETQPPGGDVVVLTAGRIARWLRTRPVVFDPAQVAAIYAMARRSDVWAPAGQASLQCRDVS